MNIQSRLVIRGKKTDITLDADTGGIWITPHNQQSGTAKGVCLISDHSHGQYLGFYDGVNQPGPEVCDLALHIDNNGKSGIQFRDESENIQTLSLSQLLGLVQSTDPSDTLESVKESEAQQETE